VIHSMSTSMSELAERVGFEPTDPFRSTVFKLADSPAWTMMTSAADAPRASLGDDQQRQFDVSFDVRERG
jgi:hypothetical protein